MNIDQLTPLLDALQAQVPRMLKEHEDVDEFWGWFAGEADLLEDAATSKEDCLYVRDRINAMLEDAGIIDRY